MKNIPNKELSNNCFEKLDVMCGTVERHMFLQIFMCLLQTFIFQTTSSKSKINYVK